jgi:hypothetical protein
MKFEECPKATPQDQATKIGAASSLVWKLPAILRGFCYRF